MRRSQAVSLPATDSMGGLRVFLGVAATLVILGCLTAAVYAGVSRGIDELVLIATGAAGLFVVALPLLATKRFSVVEPMMYVLMVVLIGFTLKTVYVVFADTPRAQELIRFGRAPSFFLDGAFWTLIGLISLVAGYVLSGVRVPLERFNAFQSDHWDPGRVWFATAVMAAIGIASTVLYVQLMGITFSDLNSLSAKRYYEIEGADTAYGTLGYVVWGARFTEYAAYVLYTYIASKRLSMASWRGVLFAVLLTAAIIIPFVANSRQSAALVPINIIILSILIRGRLNTRVAGTVVVVVLVGFVTMTALRQNRADTIQSSLMSSGVVEEIVGSRHFNDFSRTAHILAAVPDKIDYKYGSTFVAWVVAPIPRVIWKNKPFLGIGKEVATDAFGYTDRRGVPPGFLAEIAINFGVWAIPLFMFLAGAGLKVLYLSFAPILSTKKGALLYVMVVFPSTFSLLNNEVTVMVTRSLVSALPFLALFLFFRPRASRRAHAARAARLRAANLSYR